MAVFVYGLLEKDYHEYSKCSIKENDGIYFIIGNDGELVDSYLKMDYELIDINKLKVRL